jgi:hypothetical protein
MNEDDLKLVFECLSRKRRVFHYFRDRYAFLLLERMTPGRLTVADAKHSELARLINKPVVREHIGRFGKQVLLPELFAAAWIEPILSFVITLGYWRGQANRWHQVSRTGLNLVLQLNFCSGHMDRFRKLYRPTRTATLNGVGHPVKQDSDIETATETLAWARIDLDFDTGEALIEEIQTDWCRMAKRALRLARMAALTNCEMPRLTHSEGRPADVEDYVVVVLQPYVDCWDEAVLAAAITFIRDELGICSIYYHTVESGAKLKRIRGFLPPRSLYSALPKRFGFRKTENMPEFLLANRSFRRRYARVKPLTMHRLSLPA